MNHKHDLSEREVICYTDGLCPLCLRDENARLRGLLTEWIPRHSAACCMPDPGSGTFPAGPFLPKWCVCDSLSKRSRAALEVKP